MHLKKTPGLSWGDLVIGDDEWDETGAWGGQPGWTRLSLGPQLSIAGLSVHVEAWAIQPNDEEDDTSSDLQTTVHPSLREDFERLTTVMDCAFQTVEIRGREYAIFAFPHGC